MDNYKIIKYENNEFTLDVKVSPSEETVWLSLMEMSVLFRRDKSVISRHIKNVIKNNNLILDEVVAKNATTGSDGKTYVVTFYNLKVIIPVGYSVKSQNGIAFRKWANNVLKEYLLKGYAIDKNRTLITEENYLNLYEEVSSLRHEVKDLRKQIEIFNPNEKILVEHQIYTAFVYINALLRSAEKKIIIIDGYLDDSSLEFFVNVNRNIDITLITHKANRFSESVLKRFKEEFTNTAIIESKNFHDRFVIVDETVYSIGSSLNSLGKVLTTIKLLEGINSNNLIDNIIKKEIY